MKTTRCFLLTLLFIFMLAWPGSNFAQTADQSSGFSNIREDSVYLPQVNIVSQNGFGPYIVGAEQDNLFVIDSLPENTNKVTFRFIDVDSVQVGQEHVVEGQSLFYAYWNATMHELQLPLSSRLHIGVHYGTDSVANYFIPYVVFPDTLQITASEGWGPFLTNNYNLNDSLWDPVPELKNTFTVKNLPPRSSEVAFYLCLLDSTAVDSLIVTSKNGQYLDSAYYANVSMDEMSLFTGFLKINVKCNGGPEKGWSNFATLTAKPQKPILKCTGDDGISLTDSIKPAIQNQLGGHALLIDSVKYAATTNFPEPIIYNKQGLYSFDLVFKQYSIEAWLKPDMQELIHGQGGEMTFMKVDSVWAMAITGNDMPMIRFGLYSLFNDIMWEVASFSVHYTTLMDSEWHHIAFVSSDVIDKQFFFNGAAVSTSVNERNIAFLSDNIGQILQACKTQPFVIGGCNASSTRSSGDPTLVNAIDEVRLWNTALTAEEIHHIYKQPVLQQPGLIGYWNFDDLNCSGNEVSDISYQCNKASLNNGALLIPQYPSIQQTIDQFTIISSNKNTFPHKYYFIDLNNNVLDSGIAYPYNGVSYPTFDVASLPVTADRMRIIEMVNGQEIPYPTDYPIKIYPPKPIATPGIGWNNYYASAPEGISCTDTGMLFNPVSVSSLPPQTKKVTVGWKSNGNVFDTVSFTSSSIPRAHSLMLNGTDNYIESDQYIQSPHGIFSLTFWFKTTTGKGGEMACFASGSNNRGKRTTHGPYIKMKNDGAIEFNLPVADSMATLIAANKFNDGKWHHLAACYKEQGNGSAKLYIDGTLTDQKQIGYVESFLGKFYIGKNFENKNGDERVAEYFQGNFSEFVLWNKMLDHKSINRQMYKPIKKMEGYNFFYYKLDERTGDIVHDSEDWGFHAHLKGSSQSWSYENQLSCVTWNGNVLGYEPGEYDFFARVITEDVIDTGICYPLGRINIKEAMEGFKVSYNFEEGLGYFDEGTKVTNRFSFWTNYTRQGLPNWQYNKIFMYLFDPSGGILDLFSISYLSDTISFFHDFDMGEVITGSYLYILYEYNDGTGSHLDNIDIFPFFTRTILPPKVSGNFGPFDQWIAPGTMTQLDTFYIITEDYDDLDTVKARFFDLTGKQVANTNGHKINDTTWHIVYNMASLPPPGVKMTIGYYLGNDPDPALTQGPYHITINRTRPKWFDFVPDKNFHNIHEDDDHVTFGITSQIEDNFQDVVSELSIPSSVPFFGGASASIRAGELQTSLKYTKSEYKLKLMDKPVFNQKIFNLGSNDSKLLSTEFDTTNSQFYLQPGTNNIIASVNMSWSGGISSGYSQASDEILGKIKEIIAIAEEIEVGSVAQPTMDIGFTGSYKFSSRLNLITDSLTGNWGSFGDLSVTANPNNPNYNKSASYHFYSGALGMEFTVGAKLLSGLAEVDFSLDADFPLGFGQAYRNIPHFDERFLKSFGFRTYGKIVAKVFWGWYEKTVWGPKMFYSTTIWGDDMSECFPDIGKNNYRIGIKANSDLPELADEIVPVSHFNKIPLACPEVNIASSHDYKVITWLEKGNSYGERKIKSTMMKRNDKLFSPLSTIEINKHAINSPLSDAISTNEALICWAQTNYTNESFLKIKSDNVLKSFFESQDIWFACYDLENDSLIQLERLTAEAGVKSGIGRGNPMLTTLSDQKAMIIWQVSDMENYNSHIHFCLLTKTNGSWQAEEPQVLSEYQGIQSDLRVSSPQEDMALLVWLNTSYEQPAHNCIMQATFNGEEWLTPEILLDEEYTHYNYFDLAIDDNFGGLAVTSYVSEPDTINYESLCFIPWEPENDLLNTATANVLLTDTIYHLQYPKIAFGPDDEACIAVKREEIIPKISTNRISQVDIFYNDPDADTNTWNHLPLSEYVCDTTKAVSEIEITFIGSDSLLLLTNEYPMTASNSKFKPENGVLFGNPYMNLVLRSFKINNLEIEDLDEGGFFTSVDEFQTPDNNVKLHQNYPNPCSDQTTIRIELPERLQIKLEVFNSGGVKIATLADQEISQGNYELKLNTAVLIPGAYVYTLTTKYGKESMRMIVTN